VAQNRKREKNLTFASTGQEIVIDASKRGVDHVEALGDTSKLTDLHLAFHVP
jgi:hypothetical protein